MGGLLHDIISVGVQKSAENRAFAVAPRFVAPEDAAGVPSD